MQSSWISLKSPTSILKRFSLKHFQTVLVVLQAALNKKNIDEDEEVQAYLLLKRLA